MSEEICFGFPQLWEKAYKAHDEVYRAIAELTRVAAELLAATQDSKQDQVQVMSALTRVISDSMNDVLILAGNRRGTGAMKLARGMYEISTIAEYLKKNPSETGAYLDFVHVSSWRHLQRLERNSPGAVPPDLMRDTETEYNRVNGRFTDLRNRVRLNWTDKTIKKMAEDIDQVDRYEAVYSVSSELHHMNAMGLLGHELDWISEALKVAHASFLGTVRMLHSVSGAGELTVKVNTAASRYSSAWKQVTP